MTGIGEESGRDSVVGAPKVGNLAGDAGGVAAGAGAAGGGSSASGGRGARGKRTGIRRITGSFWFNVVAAFVVLALVQAFVVKLYYVPSGSMQQTLAIGDRILVDRVSLDFGDPHAGDVVVFTASDLWGEKAPAPSNPLVYAVKWLGGVFGVGQSLDHTLVKRVIAGPGQTVSCCDKQGHLLVDGQPIDEPYVFQDFEFQAGSLDCSTVPASQRCFGGVTVPGGEYFVLGDHRSNSNDSIAGCRGRDPAVPVTVSGAAPGAAEDSCLKMVGRADVVGRAFVVVLPPGHWGGL
ncbi:signal peptidase I [Subtercola frigoramans]|uniref:Signal peptidase I n=1 Tax=Subtercola frigoramans TaxID=120298 RepID=A0ABS2L8I8_9MICO|nr:signal peptidase I [Subtercola frigoramans]MBM7473392.1 signal peptidase I [Subtercola frigoramans]